MQNVLSVWSGFYCVNRAIIALQPFCEHPANGNPARTCGADTPQRRVDDPTQHASQNQSADNKCGYSLSPIQISYSNHQKSLARIAGELRQLRWLIGL